MSTPGFVVCFTGWTVKLASNGLPDFHLHCKLSCSVCGEEMGSWRTWRARFNAKELSSEGKLVRIYKDGRIEVRVVEWRTLRGPIKCSDFLTDCGTEVIE